ncbi:anthranilate phosphoribosyltransferase [candidate division WOR-3 bacterium 4484_100]|uniref:Anthranilate phosphoribosyltransferase n=1 Tax=candidate division WOR-3 bacterium 4484_100 TaxID=1936077 RepID=A0A1V4QHV0_UNCW3|nr:MAG: anthranilate phosphoribosyltransferase [candidate division WOR-3 bacterium 4484_100]
MEIKRLLERIINNKNLDAQEAFELASGIMEGKLSPAQLGALLTALRMKGETIDEITGFARAMREKAARVECDFEDLIDTCGTGGDQSNTFNISTVAALIAAGAGCRVAKHGNRSVSSRCGSADLLESLGVNINIPVQMVVECIERAGFGFLFAPNLHKAMKYAIGPRRELGVRTIFNILGPLTNPARVQRQVLGVFDLSLTRPIAEVLDELGSKHSLVVYSEDGLDEITTTGQTFISELKGSKIEDYTIVPEDFGLKRCRIEELQGGPPENNAKIAIDLLKGRPGPMRDIAVLNAGAGIYVAGKVDSISAGIKLANESIDSGEALKKLEILRELTNGTVE